MKRNVLICSILWMSVALTAVAQAPQRISYQAVARNDQGHALVSHAVSFRLSIRQGSAEGAAAYSETHAVTTNEFGLANLAIGTGTVVSGVFSDIDWGAADYWLRVEMDPAGGSSYSLMGASQILSVPYALHSETAGRITGVFTEGRIPFGKIGGGELTESASLFWNSTSNRLGLGTSTPNVELEVTGKSAFGNSLSLARLNSGYGPRVFNLIDENANVRIWRYTNTSTLGTALELALGTNDDISNAANRWWDIYLEGIGGADEFLGFRRRTGGNSVPYMSIANGGNTGIGTTKPRAKLHINGSLSRNMPVTVTDNYTVHDSVSWIIANKASGNLTLTLPAAASWRGREIMVKNLRSSGTVISASSNVVPVDGTSAGTAILPAVAGSWVTLVSNGTNWVTSNASANVTGAETKINAGTNVTVSGSGTVASPYVINSTASSSDPSGQVLLFDEFIMARSPSNAGDSYFSLGTLGWEMYSTAMIGPGWNDDPVVLPHIGVMKFGLRSSGTTVSSLFLKNVLRGNTPNYSVEFSVKQEYTGTSGGPSHFKQRIGLMNLVTSTGQADPDGVYFKQDANGAWQAICKSGSATVANTGVSQSTNFTKFTIVMNSAGNSATFYINGALVATVATNIPSSSLAACYFTEAVDFSGSSADRHFYIDYFKMDVTGLTR